MIMHSNNTKIFLHTACISLFVSETPSVKKYIYFSFGNGSPIKKKSLFQKFFLESKNRSFR